MYVLEQHNLTLPRQPGPGVTNSVTVHSSLLGDERSETECFTPGYARMNLTSHENLEFLVKYACTCITLIFLSFFPYLFACSKLNILPVSAIF